VQGQVRGRTNTRQELIFFLICIACLWSGGSLQAFQKKDDGGYNSTWKKDWKKESEHGSWKKEHDNGWWKKSMLPLCHEMFSVGKWICSCLFRRRKRASAAGWQETSLLAV
jgi:hypothetical protein